MAAILLISNYRLDGQHSMLRAADLVESGLRSSGIEVLVARPEPFFGLLAGGRPAVTKWLAYLDKFLLFPIMLMWRARRCLLVHIVDHSNAIYLFWLRSKKSVVTCNDLLAVRSALGEVPEHRTGFAGKLLQKWILAGLRRANQIVCISEATKLDVLRLTGKSEREVSRIYLGLGPVFEPELERKLREKAQAANVDAAEKCPLYGGAGGALLAAPADPDVSTDLSTTGLAKVEATPLHSLEGAASSTPPGSSPSAQASATSRGEFDALDHSHSLDRLVPYILHVGGGTWYKNRPGVLEIYVELRRRLGSRAPNLIMVGPPLKAETHGVCFLQNVTDDFLVKLYRNAALLLFPSLYEGFGWPVIEANACGCPVVVSRIAPLVEAGGSAAAWIEDPREINQAADRVVEVLGDDSLERQSRRDAGFGNAGRFSRWEMIAKYLELYASMLRE
jgi:glycosyltransferase involved in cell wall biosynthesis